MDENQIKDHETIQTKDQSLIIITIDHVKFPRIESLFIQIDKKLFSFTQWEKYTNQNSQQNYRSSTSKHQRQINQVQSTEETQSDPPGIDTTNKSEF